MNCNSHVILGKLHYSVNFSGIFQGSSSLEKFWTTDFVKVQFVNSYPPKDTYMCISLFPECISFMHFLAGSSYFWTLRPNLLNSALNFRQNKSNIYRVKCISLLLRIKPVQQNHLHFFKYFETQCAL